MLDLFIWLLFMNPYTFKLQLYKSTKSDFFFTNILIFWNILVGLFLGQTVRAILNKSAALGNFTINLLLVKKNNGIETKILNIF